MTTTSDLLGELRTALHERDILLAAVEACVAGTPDALRVFSEDYGLKDDLDPIRRIDVLSHALARVRARRESEESRRPAPVPVADVPKPGFYT